MNPVGHAPIRGYCIATAIRPIVPVPLIGADPNWLGTELYLLAALRRYSTYRSRCCCVRAEHDPPRRDLTFIPESAIRSLG